MSDDHTTSAGNSFTNSGIMQGVAVNQGSNNTVTQNVTLPNPDQVDIQAELTGLRALLSEIGGEEAKAVTFVDSAIEKLDTDGEPDKGRVAVNLEDSLAAAEKIAGYGDRLIKIQEKVAPISAWLGPYGAPLLAIVGLGG